MSDLLIRDATVLTMNASRDVIDDGAIIVEDREIVDVGETDAIVGRYDADRVVDAAGGIAIPGLINAHVHVPDMLARGLGKERELHDWLINVKRPFVAKMSPEDHTVAAALYCWESLRAGITTFVENAGGLGAGYDRPEIDARLDVYDRAGLRNVYAHGFIDKPATGAFADYLDNQASKEPAIDHPEPESVAAETALDFTEELIEEYHGTADGRQSVWPAPFLARGATEEALAGAVELAERYDVMTTTHTAEAAVQERPPGSSVEFLNNAGYLGERTLLGHCVHLSDRDVRILATTGTKVAHNVVANLSLGSGVSPVPRMVESGVTVGLGTDNACQNDVINLLSDMRFAALVHKGPSQDPGAMTAEAVLEMATIEGARAIGRADDLGSIEPGKLADIVVVGTDGIHTTPRPNPANALVYQTTGSEVSTVVCNGEVVVDSGAVPGLERAFPDLHERARTTAEEIIERAGMTGLRDRPWTRRSGL